jgi:hypothetical protein
VMRQGAPDYSRGVLLFVHLATLDIFLTVSH